MLLNGLFMNVLSIRHLSKSLWTGSRRVSSLLLLLSAAISSLMTGGGLVSLVTLHWPRMRALRALKHWDAAAIRVIKRGWKWAVCVLGTVAVSSLMTVGHWPRIIDAAAIRIIKRGCDCAGLLNCVGKGQDFKQLLPISKQNGHTTKWLLFYDNY